MSFFKKNKIGIILSCICLLSAICKNSFSQKVIFQSGFETCDPTFNYYNGSISNLPLRTNTSAFNGSYHGTFTSNGKYDGAFVTSATVNFKAGVVYTVSFYYKNTVCSGTISTYRSTTGASYANITSGTLLNTSTIASASYALVSFTFTPSANETDYIGFVPTMTTNGCNSANFWIDEILVIASANHCSNGLTDADETSTDCGGNECGTTPVVGTLSPSSQTLACGSGNVVLNICSQSGYNQWQSSVDNVTWSDIPNAHGTAYNTTITNTTYFRVITKGDGCGTAISNVSTITITGTGNKTWVTTGTNDWGTSTNWSPNGVPGNCDNVTLTSGGTQPLITASASCNNLTIPVNTTLTFNGGAAVTFTVNGNFINNGTFTNNSGNFNGVSLTSGNGTVSGTGLWNGTSGTVLAPAANSNITLLNDMDLATYGGALSINSSGCFNLNGYRLKINGFSQAGTFHAGSGILEDWAGGSISPSKTFWETGTLYLNNATNNFTFDVNDDYYNVWFTNTGGTTKFGTSALTIDISNNMWIKSPCILNNSNAGANTINIGGDFINDDTYQSTSATINMNGSKAQNISGTSNTTFYNLTINNSSGISNGVYLNSTNASPATTVSNILTLTNGPFKLNSQKLIISNSATSAVSRVNGYVVSETNSACCPSTYVNPSIMQWNISNITGNHVFPFGTFSGGYIPVTFNNNANTSGNVSISTRPTSNNCTSPSAAAGTCNQPWAGASNVAAVSNMDQNTGNDGSVPYVIDRWWDIQAGTNPVAGTGVTLSLSYMGSENTLTTTPTDYAHGLIAIQHWTGTTWNNGNGGSAGTITSTGSSGGTVSGTAYTVTGSTNVKEFSPYVLVAAPKPLPIELFSFVVECSEKKVICNWETGIEMNSDYFTLEKSTDGSLFIPVAKVKAAGNSSTLQKYSAEDTDPYSASSYYRLSETDFNAATKTFDMVSVDGCGNDNITAFSSGNSVTVTINPKEDCSYNIILYDVQGKIIAERKNFLAAGKNSISFPANAEDGIYFLKVYNDKNIRNQKVSIQGFR